MCCGVWDLACSWSHCKEVFFMSTFSGYHSRYCSSHSLVETQVFSDVLEKHITFTFSVTEFGWMLKWMGGRSESSIWEGYKDCGQFELWKGKEEQVFSISWRWKHDPLRCKEKKILCCVITLKTISAILCRKIVM